MAICPYCNNPVTLNAGGSEPQNEVCREKKGFIKKEVLYSCPHCRKVLGLAVFVGGLLTGRP